MTSYRWGPSPRGLASSEGEATGGGGEKRPQKGGHVGATEEGALGRRQAHPALGLGLLASKARKNEFLLFKPPSV